MSSKPSKLSDKFDTAIKTMETEKMQSRPDGFFTVAEYANEAGINRSTAKDRITRLLAAGKLKRAKGTIDQGNRVTFTTGYVFVEEGSQ